MSDQTDGSRRRDPAPAPGPGEVPQVGDAAEFDDFEHPSGGAGPRATGPRAAAQEVPTGQRAG